MWQSVRQAANGLEGFCESASAEPQSLALAAKIGGDIAQALRHAGVPDQELHVVRCCLRTSERLVREYPDEYLATCAIRSASPESLTRLLPDRWASANPGHLLTHRLEESRQKAKWREGRQAMHRRQSK
ncbi:MAG: hypothetical protein ACLQVF_13970 [Isosphaeraceae bacterium]